MDAKQQIVQPLIGVLQQMIQAAGTGPNPPPPMPVEMFDNILSQLRDQFLWLGYVEDITMEQFNARVKAIAEKTSAAELAAADAAGFIPK